MKMKQMKQFQNMDLTDDQVVEVLGTDGSESLDMQALFGSTAVVQMDGESTLDVAGIDGDAPWVDTIDMGDVISVLAGEDYSFFDGNQPDMPSAGLEVMAQPLDEQTDVSGLTEVTVEPISDEPLPFSDDDSSPLSDDSSQPSDDDVSLLPGDASLSAGGDGADDITLMADAF